MSVSSNRYSLYKRSNQIYIGYYEDGKRKWKCTGTTIKTEALKALTRVKELIGETNKPKMLSEFISAFMEYAEKTYSPKTIPMFRKALQHLSALIGNLRISAITSFHVDLFKTKRIGEVSATSVNFEFRQLRSALTGMRKGEIINIHLMCYYLVSCIH
ncbi:MAG: hypothetical protein WBW71_11780 [Bacteroidota bacterium]